MAREDPSLMRLLLDRLVEEEGPISAAEPHQWVVKSAVEEASAISPIQLRNELGALSKLTKRLFGDAPTCPIEWRKDTGKCYYRMNGQGAGWWLAARPGSVDW